MALSIKSNRLKREEKTINAMIKIYCNSFHSTKDDLCEDCFDLRKYAHEKLFNCKFGVNKPICSKCKIHCYKPELREKVREIMRFSGPKMMFKHPILAVFHLVDSKAR